MALLMFAAGFALGLFFGWLLHRERVERAVYEDVARNRDRATAALAETSARLELANKDMIRLRSQLTDVEQELEDRDEAIAELRQHADAADPSEQDAVADAAGAPDGAGEHDAAALRSRDDVADAAGPPEGDAVADAAGAPDADDRADVTAEVALAATRVDGAAAMLDADDAVGSAPPPSPSMVAPDAPVPDAPAPDVPGIANAEDGPRTGVQEPLASLLDVDSEPTAPEDDTGNESSSTDQDAAGAPVSPGPDDLHRGDLAPDASPAPEPADAVSGADDDPPMAEPEPDAGSRTDEPEPPVTDAPHDDETAPAAVTPAAAAPDDAAHDPGVTDDLRQIAGIGPALERALHAEGITTFEQIAGLDDAEITDLAARQPRLVSRLRRDGWVAQARRLQAEGRRPE